MMQFKRIKFHNYRCFVNGEIEFEQQPGKNINLILGTNGAGKTELLFSFWWALYGFDFSKLKNKEATPYSLNASLYRSLEEGLSQNQICSVTIEFEHEDKKYVIERKEEFRRTQHRIQSEEYQTLSYYKANKELSLPIRNKNEINKILNRIIPKAILFGIIFDGERMKQLSSDDENALNAISGVINDITNVELLELCILNFQTLQRAINRKAKLLAKQHGQVTIEQTISEIEGLTKRLTQLKEKVEKLKADHINASNRKKEISLLLEEIKEARELEYERKGLIASLRNEERRKSDLVKNYADSLKRGYLLISDQLFEDVKRLIKQYDVPVGLTVEAVDNILDRATCICGREWNDEMRSVLLELKQSLPPDNINSTIGEMVRQMELISERVNEEIAKDFTSLEQCNKEIENLKNRIASLSSQIRNTPEAEAIEKDNEKVQKSIWSLEQELGELNRKIPELESELESKKKLKETLSQSKNEFEKVDIESRFIEKSIEALERIKAQNRMTALRKINERLNEAYRALCDDTNYGRELYIVQYNHLKRYSLIAYIKSDVDKYLSRLHTSGKYDELISRGLSDEEIREQAIIHCAQPNSTGQSKMNTLAFVKAILDYANEHRSVESLEISKAYPLIIDAPFGEIFDNNLINSAKALHTFAHQIILMIAKEHYLSVEPYIRSNISTVHHLEKKRDSAFSEIHSSDLEVI